MAWVFIPVLWVHILCMSFWMGSMLFGVALGGQKRVQAALEASLGAKTVMSRLGRVFPVAILAGVVSGILLGTVFGPIKNLGLLVGTAYGLTMSVAFVLVVIAIMVGPAGPPNKPAWMKMTRVGDIAILGAFSCMALMRYGL